ncbi:GNA1162 family protein [Anaeromyxobacter diazotrophicus]|uniref:Lipoprotein n=1 Tax=Anaeromyxobacter diazotrophicus TaxID=2590199 RepID=A0A7I9VLU1_9BACT|nr:GNA1162 family protein [Anaeromyxobacter diazotrophicus]GEJ57079.1 lipoprotein [Anaeromyxobacter diazotrophicus]
MHPSLNPSRAAALLVILAACASHTSHRYQDANMDFGSVKTVAVVPFTNLSRDNLAGDRVRDVFANALLSTGAVYVLPQGEVIRGLGKVGVASPTAPSVDEVVKLGQTLKADAVITGVVKEYGDVRSGTASANVISLSIQMQETATGKVVFAGSTTKGGIRFRDRLLGGGGEPINDVTEAAVNDLIDKLLK